MGDLLMERAECKEHVTRKNTAPLTFKYHRTGKLETAAHLHSFDTATK